ncbi:MAG: YceI family protein [Acidobacteriaceae bacterium]
MKSLAAFALTVILASPALAQHQTFTINPDASEVRMTLNATHEVVHGAFHVQSGLIEFDRGASTMSGSIIVSATSGKTGNDSRDKKMDKDVLKTEQYTTVLFTPRGYTGTIAPSGDSTIQVMGVITLLGSPHNLTIPLQIHIAGEDCTAKAHFVIPYVQWGLKDPSFFIFRVEKQVDIDLSLTGRVSR